VRSRGSLDDQPDPIILWDLLPSPLLPKMDDPGMPTIHRSTNQRSFQRSCPLHGNMHYSMSKMADQDH
jgi:hypothetical protein